MKRTGEEEHGMTSWVMASGCSQICLHFSSSPTDDWGCISGSLSSPENIDFLGMRKRQAVQVVAQLVCGALPVTALASPG